MHRKDVLFIIGQKVVCLCVGLLKKKKKGLCFSPHTTYLLIICVHVYDAKERVGPFQIVIKCFEIFSPVAATALHHHPQ